MSETSALRPGQKVTLSGTVTGAASQRFIVVQIDGDDIVGGRSFPASALTPVVEPEPTFAPGDVVRIDGVNHMLRAPLDDDRVYWVSCVSTNVMPPIVFSARWSEGRVAVVYRKEADK